MWWRRKRWKKKKRGKFPSTKAAVISNGQLQISIFHLFANENFPIYRLLKGTVHQMYECVSDVLLHLDRMLGIVFMVQRRQIWPKNEEKTCFNKRQGLFAHSVCANFGLNVHSVCANFDLNAHSMCKLLGCLITNPYPTFGTLHWRHKSKQLDFYATPAAKIWCNSCSLMFLQLLQLNCGATLADKLLCNFCS